MLHWRSSTLLRAGTALAAHLSAVIVVGIVLFVLWQAWPALQTIGLGRFFGDSGWYPAAGAARGQFNLTPMIVATLLCSVGALLLAVPLGVLVAICITEFAPPTAARALEALVALMAGVPSVVYGLWGLVVLVPLIAGVHAPGVSLLAGIAVLFMMILPTMVLGAMAALRAVPLALREATAGLGFSQAGALWRVFLPAARSGLSAAAILCLARALGETMAVLMVTGNVVQVPDSLFDPVRTLTANIALELAYAEGLHRSALFVGGLLLALIVLGLSVMAQPRQTGPTS